MKVGMDLLEKKILYAIVKNDIDLLSQYFSQNPDAFLRVLRNNPWLVNDYNIAQLVVSSSSVMQKVVSSFELFREIVNSPTAMQAVANSRTAMHVIANTISALREVVNSPTAMQAILNSQIAMEEINNSPIAIDTIKNVVERDLTQLRTSLLSGDIVVGNSALLNGYSVSQIPEPSKIPLTNQDGKLGFEWLYDISEEVYYQSNYYVSTDFPRAEEGSLCYIVSTNKLYRYTNGRWQEINWQKAIRRMPEFQVGGLRINDNVLEISPNETDWYPCYPLVGASVFNIRTLDNQNYSYKYYLPPGATVIIENANHVPIVYTPAIVPMFFFQGFWTHAYELWVGLRPSNIAISNGDGQYLAGNNSNVSASRLTNLNIVPFYEQANVNENWNHATLTIRKNQRWLVLGQCQGHAGYVIVNTCCSGRALSTSYWLGTWYRQDGVQFIADYVTITRRK
ncbi:MAG: hypothetical protein QXT86_12455 [Archaeoglobaceae archaeon]